jgi:hypothetical protein
MMCRVRAYDGTRLFGGFPTRKLARRSCQVLAMLQVSVRHVTAAEDIATCQGIRKDVFIRGQNVPAEVELEFEEQCEHFLAEIGSQPVGAGRLRETHPFIKLERVSHSIMLHVDPLHAARRTPINAKTASQ